MLSRALIIRIRYNHSDYSLRTTIMTSRNIMLFIGFAVALTACTGKTDTVNVGDNSKDGEVLETQQFTTVMKNGNMLVDPDHGTEAGFWYGAVGGIDGVNANGVTFLYKFEDGYFKGTININIHKLTEGETYVAWLAKDEQGTGARPLGLVKNLVGDVRHSIQYETKDDVSGYGYVVVSEETASAPKTPTKIVATGFLKKVDKK